MLHYNPEELIDSTSGKKKVTLQLKMLLDSMLKRRDLANCLKTSQLDDPIRILMDNLIVNT